MTEEVKLVSLNKKKKFPKFLNPFDFHEVFDGVEPYSLAELSMMKVLEAIKDKPYWYEKIKDENICNKWRAELNSQNALVHESHLQYVFDELLYYSNLSSRQLSPASVDGVWMSDHIIDEALRQHLSDLVAPLEADCTASDFHPNSNDQMLDLVHPHMYLYVNGLSREVSDESLPWPQFIGSGGVVPRAAHLKAPSLLWYSSNDKEYYDIMTSATYQWLPSEVQVDGNGKCKFLSYINNLHPHQYAGLYGVLEQVLERFIPLFNQVLTDLAYVPLSIYYEPTHSKNLSSSNTNHVNIHDRRHKPDMYPSMNLEEYWIDPYASVIDGSDETSGSDIGPLPTAASYNEGHGENAGLVMRDNDNNEDDADEWEDVEEEEDEEDSWDEERAEEEWNRYEERKILSPEFYAIPPFQPPAPVDPVDLKGSRLQVIVKLANIILTPDKPEYNGGTWHIGKYVL